MASSIKDIARIAGVSHGTVSNVLNGKGNVSVEKIKKVEEAVAKIGYSLNAKAKMLRKGITRSVALVLPDILDPGYAELFTALNTFFEEKEFSVQLYLTEDLPSREENIVNFIATQRMDGLVIITCRPDSSGIYQKLISNGTKLVFLERRPKFEASFVGFDYRAAGAEIRRQFNQKGFKHLGIITGYTNFSSEREFREGFIETSLASEQYITKVQVKKDRGMACKAAFRFFEADAFTEAIAASSLVLSEGVLSADILGSRREKTSVVSLSPLSLVSVPENVTRFELNFRWLGLTAGQILLEQITDSTALPVHRILPYCGFRYRVNYPEIIPIRKRINVITLESPSTTAIKKLTPDFVKRTGIEVNYAIFPYHELYDAIKQMGNTGLYDVIRMDMVWLPWLKEDFLLPLTDLKQNSQLFTQMIPETSEDFSLVKGVPYAVPFDLSIQLLFYRKDLFEDTMIKRMYYEQNHQELSVPTTFEEYNQVAAFFTRKINPNSPVEYGTTLTLGTTSSIVGEFLPRLFGAGGSLFDEEGLPCLDSDEARLALENYRESAEFAYPIPENSWWNASTQQFSNGKVAMMIMFINHATNIVDPEKSKVAGKVGYASVPGNSPLLGGGSLGIAKNSNNIKEACEFIKWACGEERSVPYTLLGGISPCSNVYNNLEILKMYPWMETAKRNLVNGRKRRMVEINSRMIEEYQFEQILGISLKNAVLGVISIDEALAYAQRELLKLVGKEKT
jgi:multiple sugar transport system substrate-binding protein